MADDNQSPDPAHHRNEPDDELAIEPDDGTEVDEDDSGFDHAVLHGDEVGEPVTLQLSDAEAIEAARRRYGRGGAMVAAGMFGLEIALGTKKKPDSVQIQEAPSDPIDVDKDGIQVAIDDTTSVTAPALERRPPVGVGKKKGRR